MNSPERDSIDDKKQSASFIEKARELEADGDDSKADLLMGRLAKMKPEPRAKKKTPTTKKAPGLPKTGDGSNH